MLTQSCCLTLSVRWGSCSLLNCDGPQILRHRNRLVVGNRKNKITTAFFDWSARSGSRKKALVVEECQKAVAPWYSLLFELDVWCKFEIRMTTFVTYKMLSLWSITIPNFTCFKVKKAWLVSASGTWQAVILRAVLPDKAL